MYSVAAYGRMVADAPRMDAYVKALRRAVKPESVVLDLGSGPGLFALIACQLGARRVYAAEPDNIIELAREIARANGFADRIVCLQDFSTNLTLPEPADVIVSDLRGVLPWFQQHIPSIRDARSRLLASGGMLIPERDLLWAALAEVPTEYHKLVGPWENNPYDLNLEQARRFVINSWQKIRVTPDQLLVEPAHCYTLEYDLVESPDLQTDIVWNVLRSGIAHGVVAWFDSELLSGICFSNHPGNPELIYGNAFFPLLRPVEVSVGDEVRITLSADLVSEDYVWRWNTRICFQGKTKADFRQSTFFAIPLSAPQLAKRAASYKPNLNLEGEISAFILQLMDGKISLQEIAERLVESFPSKYADGKRALGEVSELSQKYSR